jgi:hypothetical protein
VRLVPGGLLTLVLALPAWAGPKVRPANSVLIAGEALCFSVEGNGQGAWLWGVQEGAGGVVEPGTGQYVAPQVATASCFHVRATSAADPGEFGEATLTVLPRGLFERAAGESPALKAYPFLLWGAARRFPDRFCVRPWLAPDPLINEHIIVGYNLPVTLRWAGAEESEAALLSFREGTVIRCLDVTGRVSATLRLQGPVSGCQLEALRWCQGSQTWRSLVRYFCVGVRGVVPFAGDPTAEPGCEDGAGLRARLRAPLGVTALGGGLHAPCKFVVADPASHRLRLINRDGEVEGGWGRDGERGCRDGDSGEARFDGPTYLTADWRIQGEDPGCGSYGFLVADSGNHVIRRVDEEGKVSTLAGRPGEAGFRDADDPCQALFSNPQGVVVDREGNLFVADRGNHLIRRIARSGQVLTVAGEPGMAGHRDGAGPQARFQDLGGLTRDLDDNLYVADGHAVRRVAPDGAVTTILGDPGRPGFLDDWERGRAALGGVPCLREPSGLQVTGRRLLIADRGNHAVRDFDLRTGTLKTLAGDPGLPLTRCGLLRDGIEGPLDGSYAALGSPRAVALCEAGDLYVTCGTGLVRLCCQRLAPGPPGSTGPMVTLEVDKSSVARGERFQVAFCVCSPSRRDLRSLRYVMECVNADGTVAESQEGTGFGDRVLGWSGRFTSPGEGSVRVRCVTGQGCSVGARRMVLVH